MTIATETDDTSTPKSTQLTPEAKERQKQELRESLHRHYTSVANGILDGSIELTHWSMTRDFARFCPEGPLPDIFLFTGKQGVYLEYKDVGAHRKYLLERADIFRNYPETKAEFDAVPRCTKCESVLDPSRGHHCSRPQLAHVTFTTIGSGSGELVEKPVNPEG